MTQSFDQFGSQLIGVVDLKQGKAVHAVQGNRDRYQPVSFCQGDVLKLLQHYLQAGVSRFYFADLDSIQGVDVHSRETVSAIEFLTNNTSSVDEIIVDLGLGQPGQLEAQRHCLIDQLIKNCSKESELDQHLIHRSPSFRLVAATETMSSASIWTGLCDRYGGDQLILGLDYSGKVLQAKPRDLAIWLDLADQHGVTRFLPLDLQSVGSREGVALVDVITEIRSANPGATIYSGGGIRHEVDVQRLREVGCNRFLIATALFPAAAT